MLNQLQIQGLRGIRELAIHDAGQVNLVVGRNDAGKTTFLEAIRVLLSGDPRHLRRSSRNRVDRSVRPPETPFKLAFHQGFSNPGLRITGEIQGLSLVATVKIVELSDEQQIPLDLQDSEDDFVDSLLEKGEEIVVNVQVNDGPTATISLPLFSYSSYSGARRDTAYSTRRSFSGGTFPSLPSAIWLGTNRGEVWSNSRRYSDLVRAEKADVLIQVLKLIEPTLSDLILLTERSDESSRSYAVLEAKMIDSPPLPLESMGDGFSSIISIITATASASHGICLIDEIENGIHYSVLTSVWSAAHQTAKSFNSQIWATTHSLDCVSAAYEAFLDDPDALRVHRFDRTDNGRIEVHTFNHAMLGRALDRGLEVR